MVKMSKQEYLNRLVGKVLTSVNVSPSTILSIIENGKALYTITNTLYFEDYRLNINNPISILPVAKELDDLVHLKVVATKERKKEAEIVFDSGYKLIVDMRDEGYYDPEAMYLTGPDNFWVVWN
jgi:hypothetical protein